MIEQNMIELSQITGGERFRFIRPFAAMCNLKSSCVEDFGAGAPVGARLGTHPAHYQLVATDHGAFLASETPPKQKALIDVVY